MKKLGVPCSMDAAWRKRNQATPPRQLGSHQGSPTARLQRKRGSQPSITDRSSQARRLPSMLLHPQIAVAQVLLPPRFIICCRCLVLCCCCLLPKPAAFFSANPPPFRACACLSPSTGGIGCVRDGVHYDVSQLLDEMRDQGLACNVFRNN